MHRAQTPPAAPATVDHRNLIHAQGLNRQVCAAVYVLAVLDIGNGGRHFAWCTARLGRVSNEWLNTTIDEIAKRGTADNFAKAKEILFPGIITDHRLTDHSEKEYSAPNH